MHVDNIKRLMRDSWNSICTKDAISALTLRCKFARRCNSISEIMHFDRDSSFFQFDIFCLFFHSFLKFLFLNNESLWEKKIVFSTNHVCIICILDSFHEGNLVLCVSRMLSGSNSRNKVCIFETSANNDNV